MQSSAGVARLPSIESDLIKPHRRRSTEANTTTTTTTLDHRIDIRSIVNNDSSTLPGATPRDPNEPNQANRIELLSRSSLSTPRDRLQPLSSPRQIISPPYQPQQPPSIPAGRSSPLPPNPAPNITIINNITIYNNPNVTTTNTNNNSPSPNLHSRNNSSTTTVATTKTGSPVTSQDSSLVDSVTNITLLNQAGQPLRHGNSLSSIPLTSTAPTPVPAGHTAPLHTEYPRQSITITNISNDDDPSLVVTPRLPIVVSSPTLQDHKTVDHFTTTTTTTSSSNNNNISDQPSSHPLSASGDSSAVIGDHAANLPNARENSGSAVYDYELSQNGYSESDPEGVRSDGGTAGGGGGGGGSGGGGGGGGTGDVAGLNSNDGGPVAGSPLNSARGLGNGIRRIHFADEADKELCTYNYYDAESDDSTPTPCMGCVCCIPCCVRCVDRYPACAFFCCCGGSDSCDATRWKLACPISFLVLGLIIGLVIVLYFRNR